MNILNGIGNIVKAREGTPEPSSRGSILIEGVSKRFRKHTLTKKSYSTIKTGLLNRFFARRFPPNNFVHALQDVTIDIAPGGAVGLVGRNGSGKSTLLKLIAGIYRPDTGRVCVNGKISALIELGAGFHPDFSGRENVYLGGVMYGLTRDQIDARFDQIVRYAELEDFIDDPVRTYSSGMYMRLGFSLAVHTDPDILLIDEVLAVGDAAFIQRCHETISDFKRRGKTLVFVTHDLNAILRWCDEALWLQGGVVVDRGDPQRIVDAYLQQVISGEEAKLVSENAAGGEAVDEAVRAKSDRWGTKEAEITSVRMLSPSGEPSWMFSDEDEVVVEVRYQIHKPVDDLVFGVGIIRADGLVVHGSNTEMDKAEVPLPVQPGAAQGTYRYRIQRLQLTEGSYFVDVAAHRSDGYPYDYHHLRYKFSVRTGQQLHGVFHPVHDWSFHPEYEVMEYQERRKGAASMSQVDTGNAAASPDSISLQAESGFRSVKG